MRPDIVALGPAALRRLLIVYRQARTWRFTRNEAPVCVPLIQRSQSLEGTPVSLYIGDHYMRHYVTGTRCTVLSVTAVHGRYAARYCLLTLFVRRGRAVWCGLACRSVACSAVVWRRQWPFSCVRGLTVVACSSRNRETTTVGPVAQTAHRAAVHGIIG